MEGRSDGSVSIYMGHVCCRPLSLSIVPPLEGDVTCGLTYRSLIGSATYNTIYLRIVGRGLPSSLQRFRSDILTALGHVPACGQQYVAPGSGWICMQGGRSTTLSRHYAYLM